MDPATIIALAAAGANAIQRIAAAMTALHEQRSTPEQLALLASLRAENQALTDSTIARLREIEGRAS